MSAPRTGPAITIARKSGAAAMLKRVAGLSKLAAYVGVPSATSHDRQQQLLTMAGKTNSKKKQAKLQKAALGDVTNAELLFIHTKGSPINHIPARPVLQPAIEADGNKQSITNEINASIKASLAGDKELAQKKMMRAALAGQNAARRWFTDPRNGWPQNAPSTIRRKSGLSVNGPTPLYGMSEDLDSKNTPLIDTGALRAAIVGVVREE
jgi:hypothetical protein